MDWSPLVLFGSYAPLVMAVLMGLSAVCLLISPTRFTKGLVVVLLAGLTYLFWLQSNRTEQEHDELIATRAECQKAIDEGIRRMRYEDGGISPDGIREDYKRRFPQCWPPKQ